MSRSGRLSIVLAAVLCAVLAGCSGGADGGAPPSSQPVQRTSSSASAEDVAWMDAFCGIVRDLQRAIWTSSPETPANAGTMKPWASAVLAATSDSLANAVRRFGDLGPSPVDGGGQVAKHLSEGYADLKEDVDAAKGKVDALPDGSTANEVGAVMGTVWPQVAAMNANPFKDTEITPAVRAAGQSPTCFTIAGWPR